MKGIRSGKQKKFLPEYEFTRLPQDLSTSKCVTVNGKCIDHIPYMKTEAKRNVRRNVVDVVDQLATSRSRRSRTATNLMLTKTARQRVPHVQYLEGFAHVRWKTISSSSPIQRSCGSRCAGLGDPAARRRAACEDSLSSVEAPNEGAHTRGRGERRRRKRPRAPTGSSHLFLQRGRMISLWKLLFSPLHVALFI